MDRSIDDYDQSLVDLDRQKEQLELLMKTMGQEWEQSGAGIGWLHTLQQDHEQLSEQRYPQIKTSRPLTTDDTTCMATDDDFMALASPITPDTAPLTGDVQHNPFFPMLQQDQQPSDYLDALLQAGSLVASTSPPTASHPTTQSTPQTAPTPPMTPGDDLGPSHPLPDVASRQR
ncbi:hypothetical protein BC940DRAFT_317888 [Gongronella butleri]|nr:hypothetical protein BC940DRAFT_317888 [Gongronella butleri]